MRVLILSSFFFTYREQSEVADLLAKIGSRMDSSAGNTIIEQPPPFVRKALEDDQWEKIFVKDVAPSTLAPSNCLSSPLGRSFCTPQDMRTTNTNFSPDFPFCQDPIRCRPIPRTITMFSHVTCTSTLI